LFSKKNKKRKGSDDMAVMQKPSPAFILDENKAKEFFSLKPNKMHNKIIEMRAQSLRKNLKDETKKRK
jgi:hypothetical protein